MHQLHPPCPNPKEVNPDNLDRFQPISLCNASYKILAKLLANRIKPLLGNLISPLRGGFVKGRHLIDNVIQLYEALHSSHTQKEKGMLMKLDMSNAFEWVKLSFLYKILLSYGFSVHFVNLIKACTDRPWIVPLVNGRPIDFFQASRGLRQGCLLSPFLYVLLAESLSRKLIAEMKSGSIPGIKAARGVDPINHALFVDDSILLGGASIKIKKIFQRNSSSLLLNLRSLDQQKKKCCLRLECRSSNYPSNCLHIEFLWV